MRKILVIAANIKQFEAFVAPIIAANPKAKPHRNDTVLETDTITYVFVHDPQQLYGVDTTTTTVLPLFKMETGWECNLNEKENLFTQAKNRFKLEQLAPYGEYNDAYL